MIDVLVYLRDPRVEGELRKLFDEDQYALQIVEQLPRLLEVTSDRIMDLFVIWPATPKNTQGFLEVLAEAGMDHLPVVAVINSQQDIAGFDEFPLADIVRLPVARSEFLSLLAAIVAGEYRRFRNREGVFWRGNISDYNLIDLLQLLEPGDSGIELRLTVGGYLGRVIFKKGRAIAADLDRFSGIDALQRMTYWNAGTFSTHPLSSQEVEQTINVEQQQLLLELLEQTAQMDQLLATLPAVEQELQTVEDHAPGEFSAAEREIVDLLRHPHTLPGIVNRLTVSPLQILEASSSLYAAGIVDLRSNVEARRVNPEKSTLNKVWASLSSVIPWKKNSEQKLEPYRFFDEEDVEEAILKVVRPQLSEEDVKTLHNFLTEKPE